MPRSSTAGPAQRWAGRPQLLVVVVVVPPELPSDLASGSRRRVDVGVYRPGSDRAHDFREFAWCDALCRRPDDVGRGDGPGHGAGRSGASRLTAAAAEKGADAAAGRPRAQVDVR